MILTIRGNVITLMFTMTAVTLYGQTPLLENDQAMDSIYVTLDHIYNFEFEEAIRMIEGDANGLGEHPANYIARAMVLYWKDRPLAPDSEPYKNFEQFLSRAIELSEPFMDDQELHVEGIFYSMCGYALLAELYSEEGTGFKVLNTAKKAYHYLKAGKDEVDNFPDFYFSTGLYNYYREKYPELYPFYKSFMWLFSSGNMTLGIEQVQTAKKKGVFSRIEASIYLYHIYLRYENEPDKALNYIEQLIDKYPGNIRFKSLYTEVLVSLNQLTLADSLAKELMEEEKPFHKLAGTLFYAIIMEQNGQLNEAEQYLNKAFLIEEKMDKKYFHYISMIYATKARLAHARGLYDDAERYYRLALDNEPYVPVRLEAKAYLED